MKYLAILVFFFVSTAYAEIKLEAPDSCVVGELVRFDATESDSEKLIWEIVPETPDFHPKGKEAFFSGREGGEFLVIIAGTGPALRTHLIVVEGGTVSTSLDFKIKELLKKVVSSNGREEAIKLAQSFRAIGNTEIPIEKLLEATAKANRLALDDNLDAWEPFLVGLGTYLDRQADSGQLTTRQHYQQTWNAIANSIEKYVK